MISELLQNFDRLVPLSDDCKDYLRKTMRRHCLSNREYLFKVGDESRRVYFVQEGILCHFHKGRRCWRITDENSLLIRTHKPLPDDNNIQAMEDCVLYSLDRPQLNDACRKFPAFAEAVTQYYQKEILINQTHLFLLRKTRRFDRYRFVTEACPDFISRVPEEYLSQYLCIPLPVFRCMKRTIYPRRVRCHAG